MNIVKAFARAKKHPDMAAVHDTCGAYRMSDGEWEKNLAGDDWQSGHFYGNGFDINPTRFFDGWSVVKVNDVESGR